MLSVHKDIFFFEIFSLLSKPNTYKERPEPLSFFKMLISVPKQIVKKMDLFPADINQPPFHVYLVFDTDSLLYVILVRRRSKKKTNS